ncbi:MAG: hypothetical protein J6U45_02835 [Alistipes sp.]|nr:hypothetical protein [Alistipes sp.]
MAGITLIVVLAIVTEALIEYGKSIGKAFAGGDKKTALTQLAAIAASVLLCFAAGADLFQVVGITFAWPWVGVMLTGILGSRGANYLSDLISKISK